jgi:hypothetical protein
VGFIDQGKARRRALGRHDLNSLISVQAGRLALQLAQPPGWRETRHKVIMYHDEAKVD